MSIDKGNILTFVNNKLNRSETTIDIELQSVLDDLSQGPYIEATDASQTLTNTSEYLTKPTLYFLMNSIILHNGNNWLKPLKPFRGGYKAYREARGNVETVYVSDPEYYVVFGGYIWLWPLPGQNYTLRIDYYKLHGTDLDNIEFSDEWKRAIQFGTTFEVACKRKMTGQMEIWATRYGAEKEKQRLAHPGPARIVGS